MNQRVQRVINIMQENLRRELPLSELARSVNLSPWWLCHMFKAEIGTSPKQHLKSMRMQKSQELLETSFLSVKEITSRVGVRNESHFVRDFKRTYSVTPTQYRARHLGSNLGKKERGEAEQQDRLINSKNG